MPSAYTSKGTGRCCQRRSPPSRLTKCASGPSITTANLLDLMSAAESMLVLSRLRQIPALENAIAPVLIGLERSGPA